MRLAVERGGFCFLVIGIDEYVWHIVKLRVIAYSETCIYSVYEKVLKASDIVWFLRRQWSHMESRLRMPVQMESRLSVPVQDGVQTLKSTGIDTRGTKPRE